MLLEQMHLVNVGYRCACSSIRKTCLTYVINSAGVTLDSSERGSRSGCYCCAGYFPQHTFPEHSDQNACSRSQRPANQGVGTINSTFFPFLLSAASALHEFVLEFQVSFGQKVTIISQASF